MTKRIGSISTIVLALLTGVMSSALAQFDRAMPADNRPDEVVPETANESVDDLVPLLNSDDWSERERAAASLARHSDATDERLVQVFKSAELSVEQSRHLLTILRERFMKSPRGAIGIQFLVPDARSDSTVIESVRPNFPAGRLGLLRPGDEIIGVDGISLIPDPNELPPDEQPPGRLLRSSRLTLIDYIVSHDPGDVVKLTIRRPIGPPRPLVRPLPIANAPENPRGAEDEQEFETLVKDVPLGSWTELNNGVRANDDRFLRAWPLRRAALGLADFQPPLLESSTDLEVWKQLRFGARTAPQMVVSVRSSGTYPGRFQNYTALAMHRAQKMRGKNQPDAAGGAVVQAGVNIVVVPPNPDPRTAIEARADRVAELQDQVNMLEQLLSLPSLNPQERNLLEAEMDDAQTKLGRLLQQNADAGRGEDEKPQP
ncbi:MAG TPA: hypothetical protein VG797_09190 [Phycisphaerales bacterium]|nr:hypothetical protein [Phycisphaerales bacterium]